MLYSNLSSGFDLDFRVQFLSALNGVGSSLSRGLFIDSCYAHCQTEMQETWLRADSPMLSKTVSKHQLSVNRIDRKLLLETWMSFPLFFKVPTLFLNPKMQPIAKAVGDWFFDRSPFQKIDCPYPCNPTCHNRIFEAKDNLEWGVYYHNYVIVYSRKKIVWMRFMRKM